MNIPSTVVSVAVEQQKAAADEQGSEVRLIAGPGTGKSRVLTQRALSLVGGGCQAKHIRLLSFTRASAADLDASMKAAWAEAGLPGDSDVRVSTVHSLGLQMLQVAGQLTAYPARPRVLDSWEMTHIFDAEHAVISRGTSKTRRKAIRIDREAFWSTSQTTTPGLPAPRPPISDAERRGFEAYYNERSRLYAYMLPSDITRRCLEYLQSTPIDTALPLRIKHLIVDEYQDLNPVDIKLIEEIHLRGPSLFIAGDDDQSIYSFRYALPRGIQEFEATHPTSVTHTLTYCFRCPSEVLQPALGSVLAYAPARRVQKDYAAVPSLAVPPVRGNIHRWFFRGFRKEATAIAASCRTLLDSGIPPDEIAILLSNKRVQEKPLAETLSDAHVPVRTADAPPYSDSDWGRMAYALTRCVCDCDDLVARRSLLGLRSRVGAKTCAEVGSALLAAGMRFSDALANGLPASAASRAARALAQTAGALARVEQFSADTTLGEAAGAFADVVADMLDGDAAESWRAFQSSLPTEARLDEVRDVLGSPTSRAAVLQAQSIAARLGIAPESEPLQGIRLMSLHGSKGLTFGVVFIPGFEQGLLPAEQAFAYSGLIQEAARLLFVAMTRARLAVVLTAAAYRTIQGSVEKRALSQFAGAIGGRFVSRTGGLSTHEGAAIADSRRILLDNAGGST